MAITLGTEVDLALHLDNEITYADVESALTTAGFADYTILRNANYDGSADVQIFVRNAQTSDGQSPLDANDTMDKLQEAVAAMVTAEAGNQTPA